MRRFSERQGHKPTKVLLQIDTMDSDLRNSLWNTLDIHYWSKGKPGYYTRGEDNRILGALLTVIWNDLFKLPIDTIPLYWEYAYKKVRDHFFSCKWFEAYDMVEFVPNNYPYDRRNHEFIDYCNYVLEREVSGYRFIEKKITPITSKEEITELKEALEVTDALRPIAIHLETALNLFSDRKSPDYRNSIKESISAVEAMCTLVTGKKKATLGDALKVITDKIELHTALQQSFIKLYGYTSDAEGIRHALLEEASLNAEDAKFMLVSCAAFINYLKVKASKAGIHL